MKRVILLLIMASGLCAQPASVPIVEPQLPISTGVSASYSGTVGATTYWYWVVTKYAIGNSTLSAPFSLAKLGTGTVTITWIAPSVSTPNYALTYVVLRTTTNQFPSNGTCTNCLVASAATGVSTTDTLGALSGYTLVTYNAGAVHNVLVDNISTDITKLYDVQSNGTMTSLGVAFGNTLPTYCNIGDNFALVNGNATIRQLTYFHYECYASNVWTLVNGSEKVWQLAVATSATTSVSAVSLPTTSPAVPSILTTTNGALIPTMNFTFGTNTCMQLGPVTYPYGSSGTGSIDVTLQGFSVDVTHTATLSVGFGVLSSNDPTLTTFTASFVPSSVINRVTSPAILGISAAALILTPGRPYVVKVCVDSTSLTSDYVAETVIVRYR